MNIRGRLKSAEQKVLQSGRPSAFVYSISFEGEDPADTAGLSMARVFDSTHFDASEMLRPESNENLHQFKRRLCDLVEERTGVRPTNELELMGRAT